MPFLDHAKQREYSRKWCAARRAEWLAANGPCRNCGSSDRLEVDHIDPSEKVSHRVWTWAAERREAELAKCQVLCHACHLEKTREQFRRPITHGSRSGYKRGCRCESCRVVAVGYNRQWARSKGRVIGPRMVQCVVCALDISYLGAGRPPRYCTRCKTSERAS